MHFFHKNILKYTNRGSLFRDVDEMNEGIIANWNSKIGFNDETYVLGDISFSGKEKTQNILNRLNGKIFVVRGNHDSKKRLLSFNRFEWVKSYYELLIPDESVNGGKQMIVLSHFPFLVWNRMQHGTFHLYGHSHGNLKYDDGNRRMDVGLDTNNCMPYSYDEIKAILSLRKYVPLDHHSHTENEL